jgi:hypothetical protein
MTKQLTEKQTKDYAHRLVTRALNFMEMNNEEMFNKEINEGFYWDNELDDLELNTKDKEAILQHYNKLRKKLNS